MLAHSPPFPIIIDHFPTDNDNCATANDVEGIVLALEHRDRVRRIRLRISVSMEKVVVLMDGEFPMLEYLCVGPSHNMWFPFPKTFQAPQLRHLISFKSTCPIGSRLLSSAAMRLVTLSLVNIPPATHVQPDELLDRVSLMPQLEILWIELDRFFSEHYSNLGVTDMQNAPHVSLPNLRFFQFGGFTAYSEAFFSHIVAPHLEVVRIISWEEQTFSVPYLLQFMNTSRYLGLRLGSATLSFNIVGAALSIYPHRTVKPSVFEMLIEGSPGYKVSNAAQILNPLRPLFSPVVDLALKCEINRPSPELEFETQSTYWRMLLRSFDNVKTVFVANGVIEKLSRSLRFDDGEFPDDLLSELKELAYSPSNDNVDAFADFINTRRNAGLLVTLVRLKDNSLLSHGP